MQLSLKWKMMVWRHGSVVKGTGCHYRGPGIDQFHQSTSWLKTICNSSSRKSNSSYWLSTVVHAAVTNIHARKAAIGMNRKVLNASGSVCEETIPSATLIAIAFYPSFIKSFFYFIFNSCVSVFCLYVCPCSTCVRYLRKSEKGVIGHVTGVTDNCNCHLSAGMQHIVPRKYYSPWKLKINHVSMYKLPDVLKIHSPWDKNDSGVNYCGHAIFIFLCLLGKINEPNHNDLFSKVVFLRSDFD